MSNVHFNMFAWNLKALLENENVTRYLLKCEFSLYTLTLISETFLRYKDWISLLCMILFELYSKIFKDEVYAYLF